VGKRFPPFPQPIIIILSLYTFSYHKSIWTYAGHNSACRTHTHQQLVRICFRRPCMHPVPRKFSQTAEKRCLVGMDRTPQPRLLLLFWRHTPHCFRPAPTHRYGLFGTLPPCSPRLPARLRPYFHYCVGSLSLLRLYCSTASKSSKQSVNHHENTPQNSSFPNYLRVNNNLSTRKEIFTYT